MNQEMNQNVGAMPDRHNDRSANIIHSGGTCYADTIHSLFQELGITGQYADLLKAYFTAKLIMSYTPSGLFEDAMENSDELRKTLHHFHQAVSPYYSEERYPVWAALCRAIRDTGLEQDHWRFFREFTPYVVQDWDSFLRAFQQEKGHAVGKMLVTLCLILDCPPAKEDDISEETLMEQFKLHEKLFWKLGLDPEAYKNCWGSVYYTRLVDASASPSTAISRAMDCYRRQFLPNSDLLEDYAKLHLQEGLVSEKEAVRGNRRKKHHGADAEGGRSEQDRQLESALRAMAKELPTDVIQALFYNQNRNDSGYECTFLLDAFVALVQIHHRILVINPSPDMLLSWQIRGIACEELCFAVLDDTLVRLYRSQFPDCRFVTVSDLKGEKCEYDRILLVSRDTPAVMDLPRTLLAPGAEMLAMIPEVSITAADAPFPEQLAQNGLSIYSILSITGEVTQSSPRKKILLHAGSAQFSAHFLLLESCGNMDSQLYSIQKHHLRIPTSWIDGTLTLADMRKAAENQLQKDGTKKLQSARVYPFSPEIPIRYSIQTDCKNRCVGRIYYSKKLRANQKHRQTGDRITPFVEKGLRRRTVPEVIAAIEFAALDERIALPAADDVLDYYAESLHELSLKTVWYCLRTGLVSKYRYSDDLARQLFCGPNQELALLRVSSLPQAYEEALLAQYPDREEAPKKAWDLLYLLLNAAVEQEILPRNPIEAHMLEISNRASKRQQSARNTLTKKTLEDEEEQKIVDHLLSPTEELCDGKPVPLVYSDGLQILGPIVLFSVPDLREALALKWRDFVPTDPILGTWELLVTGYLNDAGQIVPFADRSGDKPRRVPVDPFLSEILLGYRAFLMKRYRRTAEQLADCPIVLANRDQLKNIRKISHCSLKAASGLCKELISLAEIPSNEVVLPDAVSGDRQVDLNQYQGNLFYTNLKYHLRHICRLTEGEVCYYLGLKAPDTFSAYYCKYDHPLLQHRMGRKKLRWTGRYLPNTHGDITPERISEVICGEHEYTLPGVSQKCVSIDIMLTSAEQTDLSHALLRIASRHGMTGTIICF